MAFSYQARVVFPVDRPPIAHGVVTIDGERIAAVGAKAEQGEVIDLGSVALLPGLVNAHTHLEFSHLQRPLGESGMPLVDWIRLVIAERGHSTISTADSIATGLSESIQHGVTTLGDIAATVPNSAVREAPDRTSFLEVIGFSRARAASAFAALVERIDSQTLADDSRLGISPHAPYTVSPDLLRQLIALAQQRNMPVAMHLAESRQELEFLHSGMGPFRELLVERSMWDAGAIARCRRPLDYLRLLAKAPRALVIHGNYLDDDELAFLGANRKRMSLIFCPRTHAYFRHKSYPLAKALSAGVRVALGTDSRASNPDLDLLAEMLHVARTHPEIDPHEILRMGTLAGAEALGRDHDVGSISPGKHANLIAVPLADDTLRAPREQLAAIFSSDVAPSSFWLLGGKLRR